MAAASAGCAEGTPSADLLVIERTGVNPGARLTMLISDGGFVRCNRSADRPISSDQLIRARAIARDLNDDDREQTPGLFRSRPRLPARSGSQLTYSVRGEDGKARFADNSADAPQAYLKLQVLVRELAKGPCGLSR